jgi:mitochondrial ribonuclease P protein 1
MYSAAVRLFARNLQRVAGLQLPQTNALRPSHSALFHQLQTSAVFSTRKSSSSSTETNSAVVEVESDDEQTVAANQYIRPSTQKVILHTAIEVSESAELTNSITDGDKELEKTLRILSMELESMRQEGSQVPEALSISDWQSLLQLKSFTKRKKFYQFLFIKGVKKSITREKKQKKALQYKAYLETKQDEANQVNQKYGLMHNCILLRIYNATITENDNYRLVRAMQMDEQKLFIDCGYEQNLSQYEINNLSSQLLLAFSNNRAHADPFVLHMCNLRPDDMTVKMMERTMPTIYHPTFPINVTDKHYLDMVPKEKLIYLTPHCKEVMETYDHDAVYIIGGIVDRSNQEPLSLAKAKREGLRMAKLPLDQYFNWHSSHKSLTIDQMVKIMLDLKHSGDWKYALQHVPRRKVRSDEEFLQERRAKDPFSRWDNRRQPYRKGY